MLSILIVNWNTRPFLERCLSSIDKFAPASPYEVIVVDNASTDGSAAMVAERYPTARLLALARNLGYAAGNELAIGHASGDWLLTLNPDVEFEDDSLDRAVDILAGRPAFGALAGKLILPDGRVQASVRGFPCLRGLLGEFPPLRRLFPSYRLPGFDYEKEQPAPQPMGTFLLYRRAALDAVSVRGPEEWTFHTAYSSSTGADVVRFFDLAFPIFFNEVDLLYRMKLAGWPCLYTPRIHVRHWGGESTKQVRPAMIWESHRSLLRFMRKHYRTPWNGIGFAFLAAIVYAAAFVRARGYHAGFGA